MTETAFIHQHRLSETAFTRSRKLNFSTLIAFLINHRKGATQTELDHFFGPLLDKDEPFRHVTKSAFFQARRFLSHKALIALNRHFVSHLYASKSKALKRWRGHRLCAIDGSQLRLPVTSALQNYFGCRSGVAGAAKQAMGLASVYYDVLNKLIIDARLENTYESERYCAARHLDMALENDLILYDRGYNAFWLYAYHLEMGRLFCMRGIVSRDNIVRNFLKTGQPEAVLTYTPNRNSQVQCEEMNLGAEPIQLRLVRVDLPNETEVLITNLMDTKRYPAAKFKRLYHLRWGVEECFKRLKYHQEIENVSGKSPPIVMQDFHAQILAGNLTAALVIAGQRRIDKRLNQTVVAYQINFAQAFAKMKQYQVKLWNKYGSTLSQWLQDIANILSQFTERVRSDRKYPRKICKFNKRHHHMHYKCTL